MAFRNRKKDRPRKQEEEVARDIGGKRVKASGALRHMPGDATNRDYLVDAKTSNRSFALNAATLRKVTLEGASKGKIGILQVELEDLPSHMRKWAVVEWSHFLELSNDPFIDANPVGSEPGYYATYDGRVLSDKGKQLRELTPWTHPKGGHLQVTCSQGEKKRNRYVHHLVLEAFGKPKPGPNHVTRHLDGDPTNNSLRNLAWGSARDNANDRKTHGTQLKGVAHPNSVPLSMERLEELALAGYTVSFMARQLGVSRRTVRRVLAGKHWLALEESKNEKSTRTRGDTRAPRLRLKRRGPDDPG